VGIDDRYLLHLKSTRGFRSCNRNRNIRHFLGCHQHNHDWKLPLNLKLPLGWTTVKITLWKYKWLHAHAQHTHTFWSLNSTGPSMQIAYRFPNPVWLPSENPGHNFSLVWGTPAEDSCGDIGLCSPGTRDSYESWA
jgi:hypothetical protein